MAKRGRILRDPLAGPGLLIIDGQQYRFVLEGVWKSDVPPKPGLAVDVELDSQGQVIEISAVPESQIAKEQTEATLASARQKSVGIASKLVAKFGVAQLAAAGLLIISWWFLTALSVQLPFLGKTEITFWQVLEYLNSGGSIPVMDSYRNPGAGLYGLLAVVALAGPFLHNFWRDKRAHLGGLLPLAFILLVGITAASEVRNVFAGVGNSAHPTVQNQLQDEAVRAVSLGLGTYLSILVSLYFAALNTRQFLAASGNANARWEEPQKAAA